MTPAEKCEHVSIIKAIVAEIEQKEAGGEP